MKCKHNRKQLRRYFVGLLVGLFTVG